MTVNKTGYLFSPTLFELQNKPPNSSVISCWALQAACLDNALHLKSVNGLSLLSQNTCSAQLVALCSLVYTL